MKNNKIIPLELFDFDNLKKIFPDYCPVYKSGTLCHKILDEPLNCLFCYCPMYNTRIPEGGCLINSKKGHWYYLKNQQGKRVWDCTDCDIPHRKEFITKVLEEWFSSKPNSLNPKI